MTKINLLFLHTVLYLPHEFLYTIELSPSVQADLEYLLGSNDGTRTAALFLLKLKEERRLTQVAIDDIITGIDLILDQSVSRVKAGIRAKLAEIGVDMTNVPCRYG